MSEEDLKEEPGAEYTDLEKELFKFNRELIRLNEELREKLISVKKKASKHEAKEKELITDLSKSVNAMNTVTDMLSIGSGNITTVIAKAMRNKSGISGALEPFREMLIKYQYLIKDNNEGSEGP